MKAPDSILGPHVSLAAGSIIEQSIIRDSIINRDSEVRNMTLHNSILGDSIQLVGSSRCMNIGDHSDIDM